MKPNAAKRKGEDFFINKIYLIRSFDKTDARCIEKFIEYISDLLASEEVQKLKDYRHHIKVNRLVHSINVSYYSYIFAKKFGYDYKSAARGALLHDLFFDEYETRLKSIRTHHREALKNAEEICALNDIERNIILTHMWPVTPEKPQYKESYLVALIDDYCSVFEMSSRLSKIFLKSSRKFMQYIKSLK